MLRRVIIFALLVLSTPAYAQRILGPDQNARPEGYPLPLIRGGTQCSVPSGGLTFATLPANPTVGETCTINNASTCTAGTVAAGGGSTKCAFTWCGSSWLPAQCATSSATGGVTAVNATSPIASSGGTTPTISITNPLPVANGGTNATAAGATAANNIGALAEASNLSDVANATTARGNLTAAKSGANSDITSITGLSTPLAINQGGNGSTTPALTAGTGITLGSTWPTQSVALTTPVSVANGGTGTASPGLTAGNGLAVSGSFPTQQFTLSTPVTVANGGTQCGVPTVVASLPGSPTQGEICNVTDATACAQGSAVVGSGSTKCQVVWNGTSWLPGGGASSNGVTSVTGTAPIVSSGGTTPAISLGTVPVANGGTNGTSASKTTANNIGAAELGADSSITSLTGLTTPLSVAQGGNGTATPSLQAGANITITGNWPSQTITGSSGSTAVPINQLPAQTAKYSANSFGIGSLAAPAATGDADSEGNAIGAVTAAAGTFTTAKATNFANSGSNPASTGLVRDTNATTSVTARNAANTLNIPEIGTDSSNVVHVGGTNAASISLDNALTVPLSPASGGLGVANPPAHSVPITESTNGINSVSLFADNVLAGNPSGPGSDPQGLALVNCGDSTHALAYSTSTHTFACQLISATAVAGGSAGSIQYNNAGALGGVNITGLVLGNGATAPSAYAGSSLALNNFATQISASGVLSGAQVLFSNLGGTATAAQGGSGVASPTAHSLLLGEGASAFGQLVLTNDQVIIGSTGADPTAFTLTACGDATHALAYSTSLHQFTCQAITATATPGGTTGAMQYNNAGSMGGLNGTGIPVLQGASTPIILAGNTLASHVFANSINASGVISGAQPACADLSNSSASCSTDATNASNISSGTLGAARLPNPTASTLGGIESKAAVTSNWINAISTSGVPSATQPAFTDISGTIATGQLPASGVTAASYTNTNLTVDAKGRITAASNGTGGGGTTAGFINSPTVTAGAATLVAQCTSPGCTDDNRVANGSNASTLTLTTPASTGLADGELLAVTVNDTGTAPSSIVWTAGTGITFKSALTGDVDGTPGSTTGCGSPPATGTSTYKWQVRYVTPGVNTAATLQLQQCGPDPSGATITPALGGMIGATFGLPFDFVGTPSASQVSAMTEVYTMNIPANYVGSACTCGVNPSETDAYTIKCNGTAKGTFSLSTSCVLTLPTQAAYTCSSGQRMEMDAPGTVSGADIACTVAFQR